MAAGAHHRVALQGSNNHPHVFDYIVLIIDAVIVYAVLSLDFSKLLLILFFIVIDAGLLYDLVQVRLEEGVHTSMEILTGPRK